ncbi:uncharacterized protein DUF4153 [Larkinella arboricola]|uniref:Uncharacterized protein DUF4153 n=1 Tax=Larkinella arboricola TaxID=643671 RepID=A0A327WPC9_LARAB|nr:DUF4153 domain-containing protein [Larkinella arboricola]RAJ93068.1 uncharacterized protein DUF4153 [Larkinella arboricola]
MHQEILLNMDNPLQLEKLYRNDKLAFKVAFNTLYPQLKGDPLAEGWYQRLNYSPEDLLWGTRDERVLVVGASLLAALLAKLPDLFSLDKEFFYTRNIGFIVFPLLIAYFAWKNKISQKTGAWLAGFILIAIGFINSLPQGRPGDTLILACIHLPLLLWFFLGFTFGGGKLSGGINRLDFLRYNGELVVMTALLLLAGMLMTGITIGLFELIGWHIQNFYFNYVVVCGLAAVPIVGTFLTQTNPQLVGKVSPVIAKIFSPLVLVMLVIYLIAIIYSGKDPYNDREFLLIFNALLVGVLAIIFFSVAETSKATKSQLEVWVLFLLSCVTILVNGIALSAILFRISEWGITPNRAAVLGANVLILIHLLFVTAQFFKVLTKKADLAEVGKAIAFYLPVYGLWAMIVTFLFPFLFGFN